MLKMAAADEELEIERPENAQAGDGLSSDDASEEEAKDEVEPCRKRCGRDHALVLGECRLAVLVTPIYPACVAHGYCSLSLLRCSTGKSMQS